MIVKMFQPRFARLVESGSKKQTIRGIPKRMPKIGEAVSCRQWTGKPYRSKQRELIQSFVVDVATVEIYEDSIIYSGERLDSLMALEVAKLDGFKNFEEMRDWFTDQHGLPATFGSEQVPFKGVLITWE